MHRQGLGLEVLHQAEDRAEEANPDADIHQRGAADAAQPVKLDPAQVGNVNIRLPRESAGSKNKCRGQSCEPGPCFYIKHKHPFRVGLMP